MYRALPRGKQEEPIKAWKTCTGIRNGKFFPTTRLGLDYYAVDKAQCDVCSTLKDGQIPNVICRCGFYALKDPSDVELIRSNIIMEVELYGKVIVAERGYRAEKQRVMRCHLSYWNVGFSDNKKELERMGIEVVVHSELKEVALWYAASLTEEGRVINRRIRDENNRIVELRERIEKHSVELGGRDEPF